MNVKRWGLWRVLLASAYRRMNHLFGLHVFLVNTRPLAEVEQPELPSGHQVRRLCDADRAAVVADPELGINSDFLRAAGLRGDVCIGYFVAERLVSYFWCSFSQAPAERGLRVEIGEGLSYAYKAATLPQYRGQRLQEVLTHVNDRMLLDQGLRQNIEYMDFANLAQRSASARYGNRTIGYVVRLKQSRWDWLYHSPGVLGANIRFVKEEA